MPALLPLLLLLGLHLDGPFQALKHEAAAAQAQSADKLLLIDFTASWCPPCRQMEHETWTADPVRDWIAQHAVAIQADVDEQPGLASRYGIEALPTLVLVRDGLELDRRVGFASAGTFVSWADDVRQRAAQAAGAASASPSLADVTARYELAHEALHAGDDEMALYLYQWLWPATRAHEDFAELRLGHMLTDMAVLAARHPPARTAFSKLVDELQAVIDVQGQPDTRTWLEWSRLARHLGQEGRVISWYEQRRAASGTVFGGDPAQPGLGMLLDDLHDLLMEAGRPVEALHCYASVSARADQLVAAFGVAGTQAMEVPESLRRAHCDLIEARFRDDMAAVHAAAIAAGQAADAADVAGRLIGQLDDAASRLALARQLMTIAPSADEAISHWLSAADQAGADTTGLRARRGTQAPGESGAAGP